MATLMRLSVLVVSRTTSLLNQLSESLVAATSLAETEVEILVSWNGNFSDEQRIKNGSSYPLHIACRDPYHFASNVNALADQAKGDLLLIINDDVLLDPGSIDAAIACLTTTPNAGLVGGRLRGSDACTVFVP